MKKLISVIFSLAFIFLLSLNIYAKDTVSCYFIYSPGDCLSLENVSEYVTANGFSGAILDCRDYDCNGYISGLDNTYISFELHIIVTPEDYKHSIKNITESGFFTSVLISYDDGLILSDFGDDRYAISKGLFVPSGKNILSDTDINKDEFDTILFENNYSSYSDYGYEEYLDEIKSRYSGFKIISCSDIGRVLCPVVSGDFFGDAFEISNQYLICKYSSTDFCVSDYRSLILNRYNSTDALICSIKSNLLDKNADFTISEKFEITRPSSSSLVVSTYSYTIYGTSDPDTDLYMNGELVERNSETGLFAVNVSVPLKGKEFVFTQGSKSKTVFLTRTSDSGGTGTISKIKSAYPENNVMVRSGETVKISCIAPGQANVSAVINGETLKLEQIAYTDPGIPATYTAEYIVTAPEGHNENEVVNLNKIEYHLSYNGNKNTYESEGSLYWAGENAKTAVKSTANLAGIETMPEKRGDYITTLRQGCTDYVSEIEDGWCLLSCGGYISPTQYEFITGIVDIANDISSVERTDYDSYSKLDIMCSNLPAFKCETDGYHFRIILYNTVYKDFSSSLITSPMMSEIIYSDNGDGSITIDIYGHYDIWGWDVFTDEENGIFTIVLKKPPNLSEIQSKPLSGVKITVCSGHGGIDPGALSIAGEKGVNEAQINRANALAIGESLENLGATVQYLICEDGKLDTYGRTDPARETLTDIYICCHANSTDESSDSNLYYGTASYYHYDMSSVFSKKLADYISLATERDNNGSIQDYYSVTRLSICPSVMLEVGFVSNPFELESLINKKDIQKTAFAVTKAVIEICDN